MLLTPGPLMTCGGRYWHYQIHLWLLVLVAPDPLMTAGVGSAGSTYDTCHGWCCQQQIYFDTWYGRRCQHEIHLWNLLFLSLSCPWNQEPGEDFSLEGLVPCAASLRQKERAHKVKKRKIYIYVTLGPLFWDSFSSRLRSPLTPEESIIPMTDI